MNERILLIEDEIELQQNLKEILEYHGFFVVTADNGLEALSLIKEQEVDLILCDIMMPEMDGFQFLKIFRSEIGNQQTPFIFLSAKVRTEDKSKGLEEGADDYLTKPISARLLLNAVFAAFERKKERVSLTDLKHEDELGATHVSLDSDTLTPVSGLLNVLQDLKTSTESSGRKQELRLSSLAFASAKMIHSSFGKIPFFKSLGKSSSIPGVFNLDDLILEVMDELGAEKFSFRSRYTQQLVFDQEQIRFVIRELLENSLKFNSDTNLVQVEWFGNELSIKNKQAYFGQIESFPIEAFSPPRSALQEKSGLGLGLFLCNEYCLMNQAKLNCSVDNQGYFTVQVLFSVLKNSTFSNFSSNQISSSK
jgi:DNA-binding response OmpR family regulator